MESGKRWGDGGGGRGGGGRGGQSGGKMGGEGGNCGLRQLVVEEEKASRWVPELSENENQQVWAPHLMWFLQDLGLRTGRDGAACDQEGKCRCWEKIQSSVLQWWDVDSGRRLALPVQVVGSLCHRHKDPKHSGMSWVTVSEDDRARACARAALLVLGELGAAPGGSNGERSTSQLPRNVAGLVSLAWRTGSPLPNGVWPGGLLTWMLGFSKPARGKVSAIGRTGWNSV